MTNRGIVERLSSLKIEMPEKVAGCEGWRIFFPMTADHQINPKKLKLSKWTAVNPQNKEKHFLVTKVINPELPANRIEWVKMEAVFTKRNFTLRWTELTDKQKWEQGWI